MQKKSASESGVYNPRIFLAFLLFFGGCLLALIGFAARSPVPSLPLSSPNVKGPFFQITNKAASFDGDVRTLPSARFVTRRVFPERTRHKRGAKLGPPAFINDLAVQPPLAAAAAAPTPSVSFKGLDFFDWGAGWPPDTVGDVGPNHYIQAVNTSLGIYDKAGTRLAAFTFDAFFACTGTP